MTLTPTHRRVYSTRGFWPWRLLCGDRGGGIIENGGTKHRWHSTGGHSQFSSAEVQRCDRCGCMSFLEPVDWIGTGTAMETIEAGQIVMLDANTGYLKPWKPA